MNYIKIDNTTIGEIVAADFRAAAIFKQAGIDFCCGGMKSIEEACSEKNIDSDLLLARLEELEEQPRNGNHRFNEWDLTFLSDYIENTHHRYILSTLPDLVQYTRKIAEVHGERYPELKKVASIFLQVNNELLIHLSKEEKVLFPAIKEFTVTHDPKIMEVIKSEINRMSGEHEFAGGAMDSINEMTGGYTLPEDACNTYRVAFKLLEQFEDDLHVHVHLENNILYPKALKLT